MKYAIGVDIGGTKTDVGLIRSDGSMIEKVRWDTLSVGSWKENIRHIVDAVCSLQRKHNVQRIFGMGIGSPGPLDLKKGLILSPPNMPGWDRVPFVQNLREKFKFPIVMDNDANVAALGENMFGAGIGTDTMFYFTVSTGIGGGLIINKRIHSGHTSDAAEIGHMIVNPQGPVCNCKKTGCLEMYSSGTSIARFARKWVKKDSIMLKIAGAKEQINSEIVAQAALLGDKIAIKVIMQAAYYLGVATSAMIHIINPEAVIFGGSVTKMQDLLFKPLKEIVKKFTWKRPFRYCKIGQAKLGDDAGVLGAGGLIISRLQGDSRGK
jgi:glucokinase